jgi:acetyl esterase/lipase
MKDRLNPLLTLAISALLLAALLTGCSAADIPTSTPRSFLTPASTPRPFSTLPSYQNIQYEIEPPGKMLDLYLPRGQGPFPVVINIHGGGFKYGDRSQLPPRLSQALLDNGYAIASIDYRLSDEAPFPAAVADVKAAVRFLRANSAQYQLDPERIAVFGQSAGGNLAAMVGTTGTIPDFEDDSLGSEGISSQVQAVIDWYGPTDFSQMDAQAKAQGCPASDQTHDAADSFESAYIGGPVQSLPKVVALSDPINFITEDTPPFLIQKGDQDCTVPVENTKMLADALQAAGLDVTYTLLPGAGHGDSGGTLIFESPSNIQTVLNFLKTKLK